MHVPEREPLIRTIREALDRHEHPDSDNDGRALDATLAVEAYLLQLRGAVAADVIEALLTTRNALAAAHDPDHRPQHTTDALALADAALAADREAVSADPTMDEWAAHWRGLCEKAEARVEQLEAALQEIRSLTTGTVKDHAALLAIRSEVQGALDA